MREERNVRGEVRKERMGVAMPVGKRGEGIGKAVNQ